MYKTKNYSHLIGMEGFSKPLLENHFTLYNGYVTNTNKLAAALAQMAKEEKTTEYAELKRRFGWEFNGMRLHELYFENLGGKKPLEKEGPLAKALIRQWGSIEAWENEFKATGALRGIGWAILYKDPRSGTLFNAWVGEHDVGHLAGCVPLLVLDVFEHAFMLDYGLKRGDYIAAFMRNIDWTAVSKRL